MTPIERAWIRADAMSALGLNGSEPAHEIRRAWKRKAFEVHPDHMDGDTSAFLKVKEAFKLLCAENPEIATAIEPEVQERRRIVPRRPMQDLRPICGMATPRP